MSKLPFSPIEQAFEDLREGKLIILVDDENRENEGDFVVAAQKITPETVNFMLTEGRGVLCLPITRQRCEELNLHLQASVNTTQFGTAFTVAIDAHGRFGVTTGVSAADRAKTIEVATAPDTRPADLSRPGHVNPLMARDGGVLVRAGQTEGSVDLCRLAGLRPMAALIEIMNEDGTMARRAALHRFADTHDLKIVTIDDLVQYRRHLNGRGAVTRVEVAELPTHFGLFRATAYLDGQNLEHLLLSHGEMKAESPLVRLHSECLTGDVLRSLRCDCGEQLDTALERIAAEGEGYLIYLRQEGRGIGLINKIRAYALQDQGLDTVEANVCLGFSPDQRDYAVAAAILHDQGIRSIRLMTNNPDKISDLESNQIRVVERVPLQVEAGPENRQYLRTKADKLDHLLEGET